MEQLIELVIVFGLGWWAGARITTMMHVLAFRGILKELGVTDQQLRKVGMKIGMELGKDLPEESRHTAEGDLEEIHIKLESHSGVIYAFRKDNDQFLGQGANREQLIDHLKTRLNNVRLIVDEGSELIKKAE